jgi:hypothetical protein
VKPLSILLSALFTIATAESLGLLLVQRLRPKFTREEQYLYGFVCGSAVLSLLVFVVAAVHLVWPATFALIGALSIGACIWRKAHIPGRERFDSLPTLYLVFLWGAMLVYSSLYFLNALAPEASADGSAYHLGYVQRYMDQHGFGRIVTSMYANLPLGVEMLFLFAFSLGRHSAASLVHFAFLLALPLMMIAVGRRFGHARAGVTGAIIVFLSPVFGTDGSSAYIDVAMTCVVFALFGLLEMWDETREDALLPLIGLLAGFAYTTKLTAFVAIPYASIFVFYKLIRRRQALLRRMLILCGCIGLMVVPWMTKNAITVGNPLSPFANRLFPNQNIRISFEESYREYHKHYEGLKSNWDIPMEVAVRGGVLNGLLGPAFLLAPIGLLALRWRMGRRVLLAALVFGSTYPTNVGTRFLMAAAPFLAFAIGLTVTHWRAMAPVLILFVCVASWPDAVQTYCDRYAWRLDRWNWRGALRLQPESEYLNQRIDGYAPAKLAEQYVPKSGKIFTFGGIAQAYCRREVIVAYESAIGNTLGDMLAAGLIPSYQPLRWWTYQFPKQALRGLRLVQTAKSDNDIWAVSELRLLGPDGEIPRGSGWRLRAQPNPWQVQFAFDNCPVTRWMSAESMKPGQFIEIELDEPVELIGARAEASQDQPDGTARLEAEVAGRWVTLVDKPAISEGPPLTGLRKLATADLKRYGITHISVNKDEFLANDMARDPAAWGVTLLGEAGPAKLYRID